MLGQFGLNKKENKRTTATIHFNSFVDDSQITVVLLLEHARGICCILEVFLCTIQV